MGTKAIRSVALWGFLLQLCAACSFRTALLRAPADMPGSLADNVYTSPDGNFRIRIPWLSSKGSLGAERTGSDTLVVTFGDDLCREFSVSEFPGSLGKESLEAWVETHVLPDLRLVNVSVDVKSITTRNGPAILLRYRLPAGFPCSRRAAIGGNQIPIQLDADTGVYVYYHNGTFYRLMYVVGIGPDAPRLWYVNRTPVDEVLARFADGFEILSQSEVGRRIG